MQNLDSYIKKGRLVIFNVTSIVATLGYSMDILDFHKSSSVLLYNNTATIFVTLFSYLLFHLRKISIKQAFTAIVYVAICNVTVDTFTDLTNTFRVNFFLRDSLFIVLIFTLAALLVDKIHALAITGVYTVMAIIMTILMKDKFFDSSITMIILFVGAYSVVIYYFVDILEKTILERERQNRVIQDQHKKVNEVNALLVERQQHIEEQNQELGTQRDKLKELNVTKDLFFSIIAHDLKNPFNTIMGLAELLKANYAKWDKEKSTDVINAIYNSSRALYKLLENLLTWSRNQRGDIPFNPVVLALEDVVHSVFSIMKEPATKKDQMLVYDIQPVKLETYADVNMLHTILRNLLSNAIKFTRHGGKIRVSACQQKDSVKIQVEDNGTGMDEKSLSRLFKASNKKSQTGTDGEKGTGIGLLLCHDFVLKHNGKIYAESKPGEGSTFIVELPGAGPKASLGQTHTTGEQP